ncbi:unnamed protein product [Hanseniaspora opuntiae]
MLLVFALNNIRNCRNLNVVCSSQRAFTQSLFQRGQEVHDIHFKMTPYQVLNVPDTDDFNFAAAKKNYYKLCKAHHPDTAENKDEANEKFLMVKEAYSILKDPMKKKGYDRYGEGWKYEVPELRALKRQKNGSSSSSMYGDEQAARDRNMDEDTFWEYMNAATYSERAKFNNRSYGNQYTYTSDTYQYNPLTLLPGMRMSKWEMALWVSIVAYALDAWSRIRRFLFQRSYENYRHAVSDDLAKLKLEAPEEDADDQSVKLKKQIIQEIQYTQEILDDLKDKEIDLAQANTYVNSDSKK